MNQVDALPLHVDSLSGEAQQASIPDDYPIHNSFPVDAPELVRQQNEKIWWYQFIELGVLIIHPREWDNYNLAMTNTTGTPSLCLLPRKHKHIILYGMRLSLFS